VSGSGKTCLSLALAHAGFAYHSDETVNSSVRCNTVDG
jgi:predicted ATPase